MAVAVVAAVVVTAGAAAAVVGKVAVIAAKGAKFGKAAKVATTAAKAIPKVKKGAAMSGGTQAGNEIMSQMRSGNLDDWNYARGAFRSIAIEGFTGAPVGALSGGINSTSSLGARAAMRLGVVGVQGAREAMHGGSNRDVVMAMLGSAAIQCAFSFVDFMNPGRLDAIESRGIALFNENDTSGDGGILFGAAMRSFLRQFNSR